MSIIHKIRPLSLNRAALIETDRLHAAVADGLAIKWDTHCAMTPAKSANVALPATVGVMYSTTRVALEIETGGMHFVTGVNAPNTTNWNDASRKCHDDNKTWRDVPSRRKWLQSQTRNQFQNNRSASK